MGFQLSFSFSCNAALSSSWLLECPHYLSPGRLVLVPPHGPHPALYSPQSQSTTDAAAALPVRALITDTSPSHNPKLGCCSPSSFLYSSRRARRERAKEPAILCTACLGAEEGCGREKSCPHRREKTPAAVKGGLAWQTGLVSPRGHHPSTLPARVCHPPKAHDPGFEPSLDPQHPWFDVRGALARQDLPTPPGYHTMTARAYSWTAFSARSSPGSPLASGKMSLARPTFG